MTPHAACCRAPLASLVAAALRALRAIALVAVAAVGVVLARPSEACAELVVSSLERGAWPATVAALQTDLRSEGTVLHVVVSDEAGRRASCGAYVLSFDAVGEAAFAVGVCDPMTQATIVVLRRRSALFEHGDIIARPLPVAITAVETRSTSVAGGAASAGGSEVACSVAVRPFLRDMETGAIVHLPPGRFVLRPLASGVTAVVDTDGWNLIGARAGLVIDYEVVDTTRGEVVLRDHATLSCSSNAVTPGATVGLDPRCGDAIALTSGSVLHGDTSTRAHRFQPRCGGSSANPEQVYALVLAEPSRVSLRLTSAFDGVLSVRSSCDDSSNEEACNDDAGDTRHSSIDVSLAAGVHYVFVDGWGSSGAGAFTLSVAIAPMGAGAMVATTFPAPPPVAVARASTCSEAQALQRGRVTHGSTAGLTGARGASCGAGARGPEQIYMLTIARRSRVRLRLSSSFDAVLYVRAGCDEGRELACNDDSGDTHHSALDVTLESGTWYVFVDGYSASSAGEFDLSVDADPIRLALEMRGGITYASSGTSLDSALGYSLSARLRFPAVVSRMAVGARFASESYSGSPSSGRASVDCAVLTFGLPLAVEVPLGGEVLRLSSVIEPELLVARATGSSGASESGLSPALNFGLGVELSMLPWLGLYGDIDYRLADVTLLGSDPLLRSGLWGSLGLSFRV